MDVPSVSPWRRLWIAGYIVLSRASSKDNISQYILGFSNIFRYCNGKVVRVPIPLDHESNVNYSWMTPLLIPSARRGIQIVCGPPYRNNAESLVIRSCGTRFLDVSMKRKTQEGMLTRSTGWTESLSIRMSPDQAEDLFSQYPRVPNFWSEQGSVMVLYWGSQQTLHDPC